MSGCDFCQGNRQRPLCTGASDYSFPLGTMELVRGDADEWCIKLEIESEADATVSIGTSFCESVTLPAMASGAIRRVEFCPFCGSKL